jgi:uncharacterized membrane protein YeaQ/YmgE (transglycosylase-associated protein family)
MEKLMYILLWIVLGAIAGWLTGGFLKGNQYGPWLDILMGIAGALGGEFIIHYGGFPGRFEIVSTTLSAVLGAVVLTALAAFVNGRKHYA